MELKDAQSQPAENVPGGMPGRGLIIPTLGNEKIDDLFASGSLFKSRSPASELKHRL